MINLFLWDLAQKENNMSFKDFYLDEKMARWDLPKKKWVSIPLEELNDDMKQLLWKMYSNTYSRQGLTLNVRDINSLVDKYKVSWFIDADNDDHPEAFIIYKESPVGNKIALLGTDDGRLSKRLLIRKLISLLMKPGWYIEASHKIADIIENKGGKWIDDEEKVKKILAPAEIDEWLGNGRYKRTLRGTNIVVTKKLYGNPRG